MIDDKSGIRLLLIIGLLAIASTVVGGIVTGLVDANQAAQKFQSGLFIKALKLPDETNRTIHLNFLQQGACFKQRT